MSALSDISIRNALKENKISISPFRDEYVGSCSYDVHLGKHFLLFRTDNHYIIRPSESVEKMMEEVEIDETRPFILHPQHFALGVVLERTGVDNAHYGTLDGISSLGRLGLIVHSTASTLQPGHCLNMTLELHNLANLPIELDWKMPIAQISFHALDRPCQSAYGQGPRGSSYADDTKPKASQYWKKMNLDASWRKLN